MSTAKFEKLIDLIINEDQERAEQLFHEIVVEKSREIYESIMEEDDLEEDMTTGLMQEIETEEEMGSGDPTMEDGIEDEEISGDFDVEGDDDMEDMGDDDMGDDMAEVDMGSEEAATKDDLMDLEDKLDQLLAAFEEEFGAAEEEEGEEDLEMGGEEEEEGEEEEGEEESGVMEAVEMKKVSVTHTDGADSGSKKGPVAANSGQAGMAAKPVKFAGSGETPPTSAKAPASNAYHTKSEKGVEHSNEWQNAPKGAKGVKSGTGVSAPKPETKQASGVNVKDVVPESRKPVKKMIK